VRIPSGTSVSPSSGLAENVVTTRCLSLRRSEARIGADVLSCPSGFLNMSAGEYVECWKRGRKESVNRTGSCIPTPISSTDDSTDESRTSGTEDMKCS
jgi:hypothetical protein